MPHAVIILACLGVLLLLGFWERLARDRAQRAVSIRIHVNGTRGKSTVTRLIWGALVEAGIPTIAKTTGTAARLLLPDGSERPVRRLAPASIREQLWLLRQAHRKGARAVVAECMAIQPELQGISEARMLAATISVITNVRTDHTDAMGRTLDDIAASLANTTPHGGVLVVGDSQYLSVFERRARQQGTRVVPATPAATEDARPTPAGNDCGPTVPAAGWRDHNRAVALAVTRELGIPDDVALRGMATARPDPGAVAAGTLRLADRSVPYIDATAANDPESLDLLMADLVTGGGAAAAGSPPGSWDLAGLVVVYNHRADRPERLHCFVASSDTVRRAAQLVLTGDPPSFTLLHLARKARGRRSVRFVAPQAVGRALLQLTRSGTPVTGFVFAGNARGFHPAALGVRNGATTAVS